MHDVELSEVKGKPKVGLGGFHPWKHVAMHVAGVVVVSLMVAYPRHEGSKGSKFLCQFSKKIPNWLQLSSLLVAYSCIGYVAS